MFFGASASHFLVIFFRFHNSPDTYTLGINQNLPNIRQNYLNTKPCIRTLRVFPECTVFTRAVQSILSLPQREAGLFLIENFPQIF